MDPSMDFQTHHQRISPPISIDKPIRPSRSTDPTQNFLFQHRQRNSGESETNEMYSENILSNSNFSINSYYGNKPTVQVHPMPGRYTLSGRNGGGASSSLSSSTSSISPPETLKKTSLIPPPVPKKPMKISKRLEQEQQQQKILNKDKGNDENVLNQSNPLEVKFLKFFIFCILKFSKNCFFKK